MILKHLVRLSIVTFEILLVASIAQGQDHPFKPQPLHPKSWVQMTHGEIWPKPKTQISEQEFYVLDPDNFKIQLMGEAKSCEIIQRSLKRFYSRAFPGKVSSRNRKSICKNNSCSPYFLGMLSEILVKMPRNAQCERLPHDKMDEKYEITIKNDNTSDRAMITARSVWGILRGLESFTQLIYSTKENGYVHQLNVTTIQDEPKFSFRAVMLDSSRHFLSMKVILDQLDLMEMNKFNVFHWHLSDDESFPYQSTTFPNMSLYGAYDPVTHVYTPENVKTVIEEARIRGIRVIPEFDTPGHTKSWELGQPGLLTQCEDEDGTPKGVYGPIDPTLKSTFEFLDRFFEEIVHTFPDKNLHIGGDEVELNNCWKNNRQLNKILEDWDMPLNYKGLESMYIQQLQVLLSRKSVKKQTIVWQEIFDNGGILHPETIIAVWKNWGRGWQYELSLVTQAGHQAILSAPWYLNYIKYGSDWINYYDINPLQFGGNSTQKDLVLGGEVCLWGEFVNSINAIPRLWPRASAAAEVLWSSNKDDINLAAKRLQEHECRMMARGYPVQPVVGAGFCPVHWNF